MTDDCLVFAYVRDMLDATIISLAFTVHSTLPGRPVGLVH